MIDKKWFSVRSKALILGFGDKEEQRKLFLQTLADSIHGGTLINPSAQD